MDCRSSDQWDRAKLGATFKTFLPEIDTIRIVEKRQFRGEPTSEVRMVGVKIGWLSLVPEA